MSSIAMQSLENGLAVAVERVPSVRSASVCWLVPAGSGHEPENLEGLGPMWSELLLRGAANLTSREQADAFERLGAGRRVSQRTRYMTLSFTMLAERLREAMPLIVDTVRRPRMEAEAVEPVRDLAMQSLASLSDDPQQRAQILAKRHHYPDPINRSGYGTEAGLRAITREELVQEWQRLARPRGSILTVAGNVEPEAVFLQLESLLGDWRGDAAELPQDPRGERGMHHEHDDSAQVHIVVMHDAPPESGGESMLERAATAVLSGGMSGRLFSEVREKRGLCYSVHATYGAGRAYGTVSAYVGTTPQRAQESLEVLLNELRAIRSSRPVEPEEFQRAVVGMKSRLVFSGESMAARAAAMASDIERLGRARTLDEIASEVDLVTLDGVNAYLRGRELGPITIQTVGPEPLAVQA